MRRKNLKEAPMISVVPILASERTAAKLLDMRLAAFRSLVKEGVLPKPTEIGGLERWDVEQLRAIISGAAAEGAGFIEW
jgi:predicted DNA-binding transcriptional regulator AlpA